jgi:hypothetical protein
VRKWSIFKDACFEIIAFFHFSGIAVKRVEAFWASSAGFGPELGAFFL